MKALLAFALFALVPRPTCAQDSSDALAEAIGAVDSWIGARVRDEALRDSTVTKILAAEKAGLQLLADRMGTSTEQQDEKTASAVYSLICHVGILWLDQVEESGMVFAGQYNDLRVLHPSLGEFYLQLLLDTPGWYPIDRRWRLVPAVRDLYPKGPSADTMERIETMARDVEIEPENLRIRLAYALGQWGKRDLIKDTISGLEETLEGDSEEASLLALRELAGVHYLMREYSIAAVRHKGYLELAEKVDYYRTPADYYNAACCMNLSGDVRSAMDYLKRCLALNQSDKIDPSIRLKRDLFEKDPEIATIRGTEGFKKLLDEAFGDKVMDRAVDRKRRQPGFPAVFRLR